jgi:hypothetical protein
VIYFFERDTDYIRCELRPGVKSQICEIEIAEPGFPPRVETFQDWETANARWFELKRRFRLDGWRGPYGRE